MQEGRTKKTLRNTMFSFLYKISDVVLAFILRTIFINTLGVSYLGLSGLFTNILNVLSLMELGVGSAIVFSLYEPLAKDDHEKVASLMDLYRKTYNAIGISVSAIGFLLTPFLKYIINLPDNVEHLNVIYWLSIANISVSYFLAYRRSLLMADQRSDINTKNLILFRFIRFGLLTFILFFTHNYVAYLFFDVLNTLVSNIQITYVIKKRYPFLNKIKSKPLDKAEKNRIIRYMSSGIFTKIGQTVVTSTDSIIISAFVSTIAVGIYSNYNMVSTGFDAMIYLVFSSITASVGNFAVMKGKEQAEELFKKINMANYMLVFIISVCMFALMTPFVKVWVGSDYVLSEVTVAVIVLNFYIVANQNCVANFMGAMGELYYINRFRSLIEAVVNLVVSIVLVKFTGLGITGVFLGTTACFFFGRIWMDAHTLYKYWFKKPFIEYVKMYVFRVLLFILTAIVCSKLSEIIFMKLTLNFITLILAGIVCVAIATAVLVLFYGRREEFKYYVKFVVSLKNKIIKK